MKQLIRHILREHTREIGEGSDNKKLTTDEFIDKANKVHGNKYDYSKVVYVNSGTKVEIICPEHGNFTQIPNSHLRGRGCPECGLVVKAEKRKGTFKDFVEKSKIEHGNKFFYDESKFNGNTKNTSIKCPIHGWFQQTPAMHMKGQGCPKCGVESRSLILTSNTEKFIKKSQDIHKNIDGTPKYGYSNVNYEKSDIPVVITCPIHGDFIMKPNNHLNQKQGCPKCKESKGEIKIAQILSINNIKYDTQKSFIDCVKINKSKSGKICRKLPFDFYLPKYNSCVEYDGEQHFRAVSYWGGEEGFKNQQKRDKIKNQYCKKNGIKLIRIPYTMKKEEIEPYILKELGIK